MVWPPKKLIVFGSVCSVLQQFKITKGIPFSCAPLFNQNAIHIIRCCRCLGKLRASCRKGQCTNVAQLMLPKKGAASPFSGRCVLLAWLYVAFYQGVPTTVPTIRDLFPKIGNLLADTEFCRLHQACSVFPRNRDGVTLKPAVILDRRHRIRAWGSSENSSF